MKDKFEKLKKTWSKLHPAEALYINLIARFFILRKKIRKIHPKKIIIPISIVQIFTFGITASINTEKILLFFAISSFVNVGIIFIPTLIKE